MMSTASGRSPSRLFRVAAQIPKPIAAQAATAATVAVALDLDDEFGEVGVADYAAELPFGLEHAGCGPAQRHLPGLPAFHVAARAAHDLDHRLARVR